MTILYKKRLIIMYKHIIIIDVIILWDWGLGIGDWAQSPIPNPQSPNSFIV